MYYFKPMMPFYNRFVAAPTAWLMSAEGRRLMAKAIWYCRKHHGRDQAKAFRDTLYVVGCVYPLAVRACPVDAAEA